MLLRVKVSDAKNLPGYDCDSCPECGESLTFFMHLEDALRGMKAVECKCGFSMRDYDQDKLLDDIAALNRKNVAVSMIDEDPELNDLMYCGAIE